MPKTIMFVDDDDDDLSFVKDGCASAGIEHVALHNSVKEAIGILSILQEDQLPGLVVTDLNMPGKNGYDLINFLKSEVRLQAIKIVVLTNGYSGREKLKLSKLKVDGLLIKPERMEDYRELCLEMQKLVEG